MRLIDADAMLQNENEAYNKSLVKTEGTELALPNLIAHLKINKLIEETPTETVPENKPLTMEELRRMDGEPVFAIPLNKNADWIEHWAILRKDIVTANSISTKGRMYFLYLKDYGKTWLAYARKPEGPEGSEKP